MMSCLDSALGMADGATDAGPRENAVRQELTLWSDGFSIDDGPLLSYTEHAEEIAQLHRGVAPASLFSATMDQPVDVHVIDNTSKPYAQPKKKFVPFSGSGNRLGAPVPDLVKSTPSNTASDISSTSVSRSGDQAIEPPVLSSDESSPIVTIQFRFPSGTRHRASFRASQTVGDIRRWAATFVVTKIPHLCIS